MSWNDLTTAQATARSELAAAAPDAAAAQEAEAYLMRVTAGCLSDAFLMHHNTQNGLTRSLATRGGPNPHFQMCHAGIDPTRRYRLDGRLNESERVGVGLYTVDAKGVTLLAAYAAFDRTNVADDGSFTLDIAAGASGAGTLAIPPQARVLLIRTLHRDATGQPARLVLTGGAGAPALTPMMGSPDAALAHAARNLVSGVRQFIVWSKLTQANPNRFATAPADIAEEVRGDPDITYFLGYYDLRAGEWLETQVPRGVGAYWSLHAYNHWLEFLPGASAHDRNAARDADGDIRVRIGANVPADLANRVDTLGRQRGVLIFRTIGGKDVAVPEARVHQA